MFPSPALPPLSRLQGASATGRAPSRARARGARRAAAARRPPRRAPYAGAPRAAADAIPAALPRARRACGDAANLARAHLPRRRHRRRARARAHVWLTRRRSARRRQVRARRLELVRRSAPHARATPRALRSRDPLRLPPTIVVVLQVFPAHQAQVLLARQRAGNRASLLLVSPRSRSSSSTNFECSRQPSHRAELRLLAPQGLDWSPSTASRLPRSVR